MAVLWASSIFITSCYVIRPHEFFAMLQDWGVVDGSRMEEFKVFWGIWWFTIVKGWHFTEFALLTFFVAWGLRAGWPKLGQGSVLLAMLVAITYAATDEWHQTFVPDRYGTVTDVLIDSLGGLTAGAILIVRFRQTVPRESS
ncbi:VanZ family protein [Bremerella cremea]|nr:VanZ family protein [Bremerella cremea]